MSTNGKAAWNRGKKFPHTPEWESRRIEACALAGLKRRGVPTGRPPTEKVLKILKQWKAEHPEVANRIATANLPKDVTGDKNGNWKGGITAKTRGIRFSPEYKRWRVEVLDRDGRKCKACGRTENLQVHHIIPMSQCGAIATLRMNGVTLCKPCHYAHDEAWQGRRYSKAPSIGETRILIFAIPHLFQEYPTVGNWQFTAKSEIVIFVSKLSDWRREMLVAFHELAEVLICKHRGIPQESVDKFDKKFEADRAKGKHGEDDEPGDAPKAPYRKEHFFATNVEALLSAELGVNFQEYEKELSALP